MCPRRPVCHSYFQRGNVAWIDFQETVDMDKEAEVCGELNDLELLDVVRSKRSENNLSEVQIRTIQIV